MTHVDLVQHLIEHQEELPPEHKGEQLSSLAPAVLNKLFLLLPTPTQRAYRAKFSRPPNDNLPDVMEGGVPRSDL